MTAPPASRADPAFIAGSRRQNGPSLQPVGGTLHAATRGDRSMGAGSAHTVGTLPAIPPCSTCPASKAALGLF